MKTLIITTLSLALSLIILQRCTTATGKSNEVLLDKMKIQRDAALKLLKPVEANDQLVVTKKEDLIGAWTGYLSYADTSMVIESEFDEWDMITIHIDSIVGAKSYGHSIFRGKASMLSGSFEELSGVYFFDFNPLEKDKYNGNYKLSISQQKDQMAGIWKPSNIKIDAFDGEFKLKKRIFNYDPANQTLEETLYVDWSKYKTDSLSYFDEDLGKDVFYEDELYLATTEKVYEKNASTELLKKDFVENLTKADIFILRNSIYARHGYAFEYPSLTSFFGQFDWYVPLSNDISASLTDIELKNIELLMRYEEYAKEYYDVFGR